MSGDVTIEEAPEADEAGSKSSRPIDAMTVELATGLSMADFEALGTDSPPDVRADIAAKFTRAFDRLAKGAHGKLAGDLLHIFSKDRDKKVRKRFAEGIMSSPYLPLKIARRLACDQIDVATPILERSPVLDDALIEDVIKTLPESHALAIADRKPLGAPLADLLIERKGTKRIVLRLLDNADAELSEATLRNLQSWAESDPDIDARLQKRPNLPFAFVNQCVDELAERVQWPSLCERVMTKFEATQLQNRFEGRSGHRGASKGQRHHRLKRTLKEAYERGSLRPSTLLAFLRDGDVDRLECGLSVMTDLEFRWVRRLLHSSDKRALIALCLKAGFNTADYLAFRIALGLAELGSVGERPTQRYPEKTMQFAKDQFEAMRANPGELKRWLPLDVS